MKHLLRLAAALGLLMVLTMPALAQESRLIFVDQSEQLDRAMIEQAAQPLLDRGAEVAVYLVNQGDSTGVDFLERLQADDLATSSTVDDDLVAIYVSRDPRYSELRGGDRWNAALLANDTISAIRTEELNPALADGDFTGAYVNALAAIEAAIAETISDGDTTSSASPSESDGNNASSASPSESDGDTDQSDRASESSEPLSFAALAIGLFIMVFSFGLAGLIVVVILWLVFMLLRKVWRWMAANQRTSSSSSSRAYRSSSSSWDDDYYRRSSSSSRSSRSSSSSSRSSSTGSRSGGSRGGGSRSGGGW